ncbi:preprotein translocase subunit SecE [Oenococcus sicerae]|uniref:Preprotein translocase subunit SecE n=1 Tax=Oenococcus sicerae TaxID=2203724 RepID=A0AAJ1RAX7_9LACO|nr:preprotein translocase subunit SecE [Oenococcus sicerae]MDN6900745.1 preprotein translocase subunit SecE [Oenococcus sicerae]VDK14664.1 hypothetical protein OAL24_00133 [Oenococcus sicerae]
MIRYIKGTIEEMKRVTWLNGSETSRDTSYVVVTSILFSSFLALADFLIGIGIKFLMNK